MILSLALKTATDELKEMFFRNMSRRTAEPVREEMDFLGPVRLDDVEGAQGALVGVIERLEREGKIVRGEDVVE